MLKWHKILDSLLVGIMAIVTLVELFIAHDYSEASAWSLSMFLYVLLIERR